MEVPTDLTPRERLIGVELSVFDVSRIKILAMKDLLGDAAREGFKMRSTVIPLEVTDEEILKMAPIAMGVRRRIDKKAKRTARTISSVG